ncbi:MAG: metallophosphoesterase [Actinomycetia bacterium]|nr:metallophosphoesterase [Actinomycetes bacterium]
MRSRPDPRRQPVRERVAKQLSCFVRPQLGRVKGMTAPVPGNHEYQTAGAGGYFDYFGAAAGDPQKGYYSYDVGAWHLIALNSNCASLGPADGCAEGTPQNEWLKADLAASPNFCTLAYWHHPLVSTGRSIAAVKPFWDALYAAQADVVLSGHSHNYERFVPLNPDKASDPTNGIREFVVGTGGKSHELSSATPPPTSEVRNVDTFGVLELTLNTTSYDWNFIPSSGGTFTDVGSGTCH